jgi:hypothetical protein
MLCAAPTFSNQQSVEESRNAVSYWALAEKGFFSSLVRLFVVENLVTKPRPT